MLKKVPMRLNGVDGTQAGKKKALYATRISIDEGVQKGTADGRR